MRYYLSANTFHDSSHRWTEPNQPLAFFSIFIIHLSPSVRTTCSAPWTRRPSLPPPRSQRCVTDVPHRPRGAQPPVSLLRIGNTLKDVKLHHQEAERLASFHRNFVAKPDSWISVYYFYQKYSSSSNPLLYLWHPQTFPAGEARLLCTSAPFMMRHTISNAERSNKLFSSR